MIDFLQTISMTSARQLLLSIVTITIGTGLPAAAQRDHDHAALAKFHPLARMGEISDVVDAVLYLQNATFLTGENIRVNGGVHAGR
jgi:NAD(P)-dependent dehydrogenase (short-subunit alcohol dehydrogenase family)